MSLNCLGKSIIHAEDKQDCEATIVHHNEERKPDLIRAYLRRVERNWSGELRPKPDYNKVRSISNLGPTKKPNKGSPITIESAPATPRLMRCGAMRRDWSLEDLRRALQG